MSQSISEILDVNRVYKISFGHKAENCLNRITMNPSSASPGETLYIHIPKLSDNVVIVPGSVGILCNLTLATGGQANNTLINNIGRNLINRLRVVFGGETLQDTHRYDLFSTYHDLFLSKEERRNLLREGVSSANMRLLRSGAGNKVTTDAKEVTLASIHTTRYRIPLNHPIIDNHGVFYGRALPHPLTFEVTLPQNSDIIVSSDTTTKTYSYSLTNLELEYQCITSDYLSGEAQSAYQVGKGFYYENVLLHKTFTISKPNDSVINEHVNIPRRSLSGILCLFTESHTAGARDSEKFVNPNITSIKVNIDGMPNKLYSKGMVPSDFWYNILKRMGLKNFNIEQKDFYSDKFGLWIDLRTFADNDIHGNGLLLNSTKDGVKLEINRKVGGSGNIICYMFVVGDALMEIQDSNLKSIMY